MKKCEIGDLTVWMGIRRVIEQVNANALAA